MMAVAKYALVLLLCGSAHSAQTQLESGKNPIRKIVTLMQNMQKELETEGEKAKELQEKFMCYCKTTFDELTTAGDVATASIDENSAKLSAETAEKAQITQELADHKTDRESAKRDLEEASSLRQKEAAEAAAVRADSETNIAAMASAIPALEKGMGGASLLQTPSFRKIRQITASSPSMDSQDQRDMLAFLDQSEESPGAGQIVGILKQMKEEFEGSLKGAVADEESAAAGFADLKASKEKEIEVATEAIETKMGRSGSLAVSVVQTKDAVEDSTAEAADTVKTLGSLKTQCADSEKAYATATQERTEEVSALGQAIGVLNDDDALEVFKKAVPSAMMQVEWTGFLQRSSKHSSRARKAQALLAGTAAKYNSPQVKLMLFTLSSKLKAKSGSKNFADVVTMVDDMVVLLGKQQVEDDKQREWCKGEMEKAADEDAATNTQLGKVEASTAEYADAIAQLGDEIKTLTTEITELDATVAGATEQRKADHAEYLSGAQMAAAAVALIEKAMSKLASFMQLQGQSKASGVVALMDDIIHETQMGQKDAEFAEKTAQTNYADLMGDAQGTRAQDSTSITDKTAAKVELEGKLVGAKENLAATNKQLMAGRKMIADLHASCDFINQNYDLRKEARASEIDSLKNAKAVLSGAKL